MTAVIPRRAELKLRATVRAQILRRKLEEQASPDLTLRDFVHEAFHLVEPESRYLHGWHIDAICDHLMAVYRGQIENLIINIPPRFMKSLLVSVFFPSWAWTQDPGARFIYGSYHEKLSIRDSVKTRRIVESTWYQEQWGHRVQLVSDQNEKRRFDNDRGGFRIASSVGGGNTGEGGDFVIADDPHNAKEQWSEAARQTVAEWWDDVMTSRGGRLAVPRRIIVMQRLHQQDLVGHVLDERPNQYVLLRLPMEYEPKALVQGTPRRSPLPDPDPRTEPNELLWEERFPASEVAKLKGGMSAYAIAGQYQQRPAPAEGGIFKREHWRFWQPRGEDLGDVVLRMGDGRVVRITPVALPEHFEMTGQSWDMTFKAKRTSDFVAGHVWSRLRANAYLRARRNERLDFPATVRAVREMSQDWPEAGKKWVEDAANGPAVIQTLRGEIPGMIAVRAEGDKVARAHSVTYLHEGTNLYLPHPALHPWVWDVIEQFAAFPNGANDDDVDAGVQALRQLFRLELAPRRGLGSTQYTG